MGYVDREGSFFTGVGCLPLLRIFASFRFVSPLTSRWANVPTARLLLQFASPQLREDVEVVDAAVKQNPDAIRFLDAQRRASGQ